MLLVGPGHDIQFLHAYIQQNFATINKQLGEIGTCKKVINLESAIPDEPRFKGLALAIMHGNTQMHEDLIYLEHRYLTSLDEKDYPVVKLHGEVFPVEVTNGKKRFGMLMDYVPNAAFIETKTPFSLETMILSGLLGIPTKAQEAWLVRNLSNLKIQINETLSSSEIFEDLKIKVGLLKQQFKALIDKLKAQDLAISDLQMLITSEGKFTIIDPLDVVCASSGMSEFSPDKRPDPNFLTFLQNTKLWLINAYQFCERIEHSPTTANDIFANADFYPLANNFAPQFASGISRSTLQRIQHSSTNSLSTTKNPFKL